MKIKIIAILTFVLIVQSFGAYFENVNSLSANVHEETFYNKQKKTKEYILRISFPETIYKEILFPELNAGEKYLYKDGKKFTYYPILEEAMEEDIDSDENYIMKTLKDIKKENEDIIKVELDGKLQKIIYTDGYEVHFSNYYLVDSIDFPQSIKIYENGYLISELNLKDTVLNKANSFEESVFNE